MVGSRIGNLSRWPSLTANRLSLFSLGIVCLTLGLWTVSPSFARSREPTSTQLIQEGLPRRKTIKTASKRELTNTICRAVTRHRAAAAGIASTGTGARPELAGEITVTVLRCAGKIDCDFVAKIVAAASQPGKVSKETVGDAAIARAPDCAETIDKALRPPPKEPSPLPVKTENAGAVTPRPNPDEGFDPLEPLRLVCDSGNPRVLRASEVEEFLRTHPGAALGDCPATPSPSPTPSFVPAILLASPTPSQTENPPAGR
jgi:hypothetical protein